MTAIEVCSVSKTFTRKLTQKVPALNDVSFKVDEGTVFGFIGPNGAGKSTTIKILMGLLRPDCGSTTLYGRSSLDPAARRRVGFLAENPAYYDFLTPRELLEFVACHYDPPAMLRADKVREVLELIGLAHAADRPIRTLSKGMVQRIGLGQALVHDPDLYILDEPMSGLDPLGRALVAEVIQQLKRQGKTVLYSTHIINDVEQNCDDVALLLGGEVKFQGAVRAVVDESFSHYEVVMKEIRSGIDLPAGVTSSHDGFTTRLVVPRAELNIVLAQVGARGGELLSVEPVRKTLESIFVDLIKSGGGFGNPA